MAELSQADLDKLVEQFLALKSQEDKLKFYQENPALAKIFRLHLDSENKS